MLTNDYNLPPSLFRALSYDGYNPGDRHSDISTTALIAPPLIRQLRKRHGGKVQEDVSSRVWSLLGKACHYVAEKSGTANALVEERLYMDVNGWTISGQIDLYEDKILTDIKVTSVYSFLLGEKQDWLHQLSTNASLLRHAGFEVNGVQIVAILKDWSYRKAMYDGEYPQTPIIVKPFPLWPNEKCLSYIQERVRLHQEAEKLEDDQIPLCTPQERWERPESWAVVAKGAKRATAVLQSEEEANQRLVIVADKNPKKKFVIEHRPGEAVRCGNFCNVAKFCRYGQLVVTQ